MATRKSTGKNEQPTPEPTPVEETKGSPAQGESKSESKSEAKAKTPPPTLDQMAENPLCAPLVTRIRELQEADDAVVQEARGNTDLQGKMDTDHATMVTCANEAIKALTEYRDGIADAENGVAAALTGRVSRWSQKKDGTPSALDNFAKASVTYRKSRKAYRDSITTGASTPNGKEINTLRKHAEKLFAL